MRPCAAAELQDRWADMTQFVASFEFEGMPPSWTRVVTELETTSGLTFSTIDASESVTIRTGQAWVVLERDGATVSLDCGSAWPPLQTYLEDAAVLALHDLGGRAPGKPPRRAPRWKAMAAGQRALGGGAVLLVASVLSAAPLAALESLSRLCRKKRRQ